MRKAITFIQAVVIAAGILVFWGCDSENDKTYDVTIEWLISDMPGCESASLSWLPEELQDPAVAGTVDNKLIVDEIELKVFEEQGDTEPIRNLTLTCNGSNNSYIISSLDRGTYYVTLDGMATYDDVTLPYFQGSAEIVAPSDENTVIPLRIVDGSAKVMWRFPDGTMCNANGVDKVSVSLIGELRGKVYTAPNVPCDDGVVVKDGVQWDIYHTELEGYNASNTLTHTGSSDASFKVRPGEEVKDVVSLEEI
jgi:hypothetical protein